MKFSNKDFFIFCAVLNLWMHEVSGLWTALCYIKDASYFPEIKKMMNWFESVSTCMHNVYARARILLLNIWKFSQNFKEKIHFRVLLCKIAYWWLQTYSKQTPTRMLWLNFYKIFRTAICWNTHGQLAASAPKFDSIITKDLTYQNKIVTYFWTIFFNSSI